MTDDTDQADDDPRERMETAIREIRHEGWKAAAMYAIVDAVAVMLAVDLVVTTFDPSWTPSGVGVVSTVPADIASVLAVTGPVSIPGSVLLGGALGLVVLVGEFAWRVRQPLVERFEAGNPAVAEALRTARDAVERDADSEMARRLYANVLDRLEGTSSTALVNLWRMTATVVLVLVLSVAAVQVAVYDVSLDPGGEDAETTTDEQEVEYSGLQEGSTVLGDPGSVTSGDENLTAQVSSTRGDEEIDDPEDFPETGGRAGGAGGAGDSVQEQQAGFSQREEIEDAELVREYNVRIRNQEN